MHRLKHLLSLPKSYPSSLSSLHHRIQTNLLSTSSRSRFPSSSSSSRSANSAEDEWNHAWESAWLPDDPSVEPRSEWEADVNLPSVADVFPSTDGIDDDAKALVAEMDEKWSQRRAAKKSSLSSSSTALTLLGEKSKKRELDEYRLKKQRIHAGMWVKEIEKMEEAKLVDSTAAAGGDIDRLFDSCSEFFDSGNIDLSDSKIPSTSEFKSKPDGWETTTKNQDGNIWEISQREEDILLQEFERRIAFSKFQIASFIKTHIFSRRRPIDGWKYMIEELGPNAKRGKGAVQRVPALADQSTQPFIEERPANIAPPSPKRTSTRRK